MPLDLAIGGLGFYRLADRTVGKLLLVVVIEVGAGGVGVLGHASTTAPRPDHAGTLGSPIPGHSEAGKRRGRPADRPD